MGRFLKYIGVGMVYLLLFPFLVLGIAVGALYAFGQGVYFFFRGTIRFFKGDSFLVPLKEDEAVARAIKAQQEAMYQEAKPDVAPVQGPTYVQNNYYGMPQNAPAQEQPQSLPNNDSPSVAKQPTYIDQTPTQNQEFPAIPENLATDEPTQGISDAPSEIKQEDDGYDDLF